MPLPKFLDNPQDKAILAELQAFNQKHIEPLDVDHTEAGTVKIFNVGPSAHLIPCGGLGEFLVKSCPEAKAYSEPLELWRQYPEGKNDDMNKMSLRLLDGNAIAESLVSFGKFCDPSSDLRKHGVFVCGAYVTIQAPGEEPTEILASEVKAFKMAYRKSKIIQTRKVTKVAIQAARKNGDKRPEELISEDILAANLPNEAELEDAHARLSKYCMDLVAMANSYFRAGNLLEIQPLHLWAAGRTGNTGLPWAKGVVMMTACTICGNTIPPEVAICLGCKTIVPGMEEAVKARRVPGYEWLWNPPKEFEGKPAGK